MKNYVVWTNCTVDETPGSFPEGMTPVNTDAARNGYQRMFEISRASAKKFLQGPWEEVVYTDPAPSRLAIFQRNWQRRKKLNNLQDKALIIGAILTVTIYLHLLLWSIKQMTAGK